MVVVRRPAIRALALVLAIVVAVGLSACLPAPALTKTELDAKKLPKTKHPKLSERQMQNCRSCHREAPAIRE